MQTHGYSDTLPRMKRQLRFSALFALMLALATPTFAGSDKPSADELIAKSLAAFAAPDLRDPAAGRNFEGEVSFRNIVGNGAGGLQGTATLMSRGKDFRLTMIFNNPTYSGENILVANGKSTVGVIKAGVRSNLGNFLDTQTPIFRSGLFGGELSTAWPFWDQKIPAGVKLISDGLKKIEGEKLYEVRYLGPKQGDINIYLYFDPETGHHVMTQYRLPAPSFSSSQFTAQSTSPGEIVLQEKFSNFKPANGVNLPLVWTIRWIQGEGSIQEWQVVLQKMNPTLPADAFALK